MKPGKWSAWSHKIPGVAFTDSHLPFTGISPVQTDKPSSTPAIRDNFAPSTKNNYRSMKTKTILLTAILALQLNFLIAGSDVLPLNPPNPTVSNSTTTLVSMMPVEATFEEDVTPLQISIPAPVPPMEATFFDEPEMPAALIFAPEAPVEADFSDDAQ
ncbi:MAG: hypothetical protein ACOYNC_11645 [Bacteroidales bacterium]